MNKILKIVLLLLIPFQSFSQIIDTIKFEGIDKIKPGYLLRTINSHLGGTIDSLSLEKEMKFLKRMPGINQAQYSIKTDSNRTELTYKIEESLTILPDLDLRIAGGLTTYRIGFQEFNLFGRGIRFKTAYQNNGKGSFFIESDIPYIIDRFGLKGVYQNIKSDEPFYIDADNRVTYEFRQQITELLIDWQLSYNNRFEFGGGWITESFTNNGNPQSADLDLPQRLDYEKFLLKVSHSLDHRNWNYFLTDGLFTYTQFVKIFDQNNDITFDEFRTYINYYQVIKKKTNLAFRGIIGFSTNSDSPLAPFVLDSHQNIRGIGDRQYRGTGILVLNAEYRRTLYDRGQFASQAVVFTDIGASRMPGQNFPNMIQDDFSRFHVGGGIRLIYKKAFNSIFRIDYGYGLDSGDYNGFVIGLGQYF